MSITPHPVLCPNARGGFILPFALCSLRQIKLNYAALQRRPRVAAQVFLSRESRLLCCKKKKREHDDTPETDPGRKPKSPDQQLKFPHLCVPISFIYFKNIFNETFDFNVENYVITGKQCC